MGYILYTPPLCLCMSSVYGITHEILAFRLLPLDVYKIPNNLAVRQQFKQSTKELTSRAGSCTSMINNCRLQTALLECENCALKFSDGIELTLEVLSSRRQACDAFAPTTLSAGRRSSHVDIILGGDPWLDGCLWIEPRGAVMPFADSHSDCSG